jgi:hypothetical protein
MTATKMTPAARKARTTRRTAAMAFYVCATATLAANMYASNHTPVGILTGLWGPLALFVALELLERVPCRGRLGRVRQVAVGVIALMAGWTSYWHLVDVFYAGGADAITAHGMPLTVDLLMAIGRAAMVARPSAPARRKPQAKPVRKLRSVA